MLVLSLSYLFFFLFQDTATPEIYPLSLHDALPISEERTGDGSRRSVVRADDGQVLVRDGIAGVVDDLVDPSPTLAKDRKSTRLNSSHTVSSNAASSLKKKR